MTSRADLKRLAGSLATLGTELEEKGPTVWDRLASWRPGPQKAAGPAGVTDICQCNHSAETHDVAGCLYVWFDEEADLTRHCHCAAYVERSSADPSGDDRRGEHRQAARAAEHFDEFRADLTALDRLVQKVVKTIDMADPPTMEAIRNRRTGEFDPETAVDALAAGFCPNCWAAGVRQVPLCPTPEGRSTVARYGDRCRPCGDFRHAEGIDKPKELVVGHAQIPPRRFSPSETEKIIKAAKDRANPKKSKGKKRGRKAA
jgi:hypothetical protein